MKVLKDLLEFIKRFMPWSRKESPQYISEDNHKVWDLLELEILGEINKRRFKKGLRTLTPDRNLYQTSIVRAIYFRLDHQQTGNFDNFHKHEGIGDVRRLLEGLGFLASGENLIYQSPNALKIVNSWENSPKHNSVMFNPNMIYVGIGLARKGRGVFVCLSVGKPKK